MIKEFIVGWSLDQDTEESAWNNKVVISAVSVNEAATLYVKYYGVGTYANNPTFKIHVKDKTNG